MDGKGVILRFSVKEDTIYNLFFEDKNIIYPWGIEAGDSNSFFSLEQGAGYRYEEEKSDLDITENKYSYRKIICMHDGKWGLDGCDTIDGSKMVRYAKIKCLENTFFLDFVMRFRFKKKYFEKAYIADRIITHKNANVYYQYQVNHVTLRGELEARIDVIDYIVPEKMKPYMYVRDFGDEWVVHARMLPTDAEKKVIKLCTQWYKTKPLPEPINNILCRNEKIYEYLKYHNEKEPYQSFFLKKLCPNAFPLIMVQEGKELMWKVEVMITSGQ